jgi:uroporphyrinogen decarboxylase
MLINDVGIDAHHPIEPSSGMDIFALKQQYGDKITLMGNLDCGELLTNGTRDEVVEQARALIYGIAPGGGYIFSSSNSIHDGVKLENLFAMLDTVKSYGRYPIQP